MSSDLGREVNIPAGEYDFIVRTSDTSNLTVYYVTNDSKKYTIVATSYEEALTVAGFTAEATIKDAEESYQARNCLLTWGSKSGKLEFRSKDWEAKNLEAQNGT